MLNLKPNKTISRRTFVKKCSQGGFTLTLGTYLLPESAFAAKKELKLFEPNVWIKIQSNNKISFVLDRVEMGQGTLTALAQLVAEELEIEPSSLDYEFASANRVFDNSVWGHQMTGGSASIKSSWVKLREMANQAKMMMLRAASKKWQVEISKVYAKNGSVYLKDSSQSITFGDLIPSVREQTKKIGDLKSIKNFKVIGKPIQRLDNRIKCTGRAKFGIDVSYPGMVIAQIIRPPLGATLDPSTDFSAAKAVRGVEKIFSHRFGIVVIGSRYHNTKKAIGLIQPKWKLPNDPFSSKALVEKYSSAMKNSEFKNVESEGNVSKYKSQNSDLLTAAYQVPFLAHATLEPQNSLAYFSGGKCHVVCPTQNLGLVHNVAAAASGLSLENVVIHQTFLGGGFGRRLASDFVEEAVVLAKELGKPVKVIWSREEDTKHDFYRPAAMHQLMGGTSDGKIKLWEHKIVSESLLKKQGREFVMPALPNWIPYSWRNGLGGFASKGFGSLIVDQLSVEGANNLPYEFKNQSLDIHGIETPVPLGFWRSVGHSGNAFPVESFMDELAHKLGKDPLELRMELLKPDRSRHKQILEMLREKSNWGSPVADGGARGIAVHESFGSVCGQVWEMKMEGTNVRITKAICVVHCGLAINPDIVKQQLEGGMIFGMSQALFSQIDFENGECSQSNFHDFKIARINHCPKMECYIIPSEAEPTGVGEPGVPPVAPAIANAYFALTKTRLRNLPMVEIPI